MQDTSVSNSAQDRGAFAPGLWAAVFTWAGAVASVALIIGVAVWTYKLGVRDARDVPIIQAMAGPAKVAPADPGGKVVAHQGLAVNEVLAGATAPSATRGTPAPGAAELSDEDKPKPQLAALEQAAKPKRRPVSVSRQAASVSLAHVKIDDEGSVPTLGEDGDTKVAQIELPVVDPSKELHLTIERNSVPSRTSNQPKEQAPLRPAPKLTLAKPDAVPNVETSAAPKPAATQTADVKDAPVIEPLRNVKQAIAAVQAETKPVKLAALSGPNPPAGVGSRFAPSERSAPKPRNRAVLSRKPAVATQALASRGSVTDVSPGTRMVQLGAYGSEAVAKRQWDLIYSANSDLLGAKQRYIQRTQSNGKTFYRLRASSFASLEASKAACSALEARGVPCIPTVAN